MAKTNKIQKPTKQKLPSVWQLIKNTKLDIVAYWRPIIGVLLVYAALYFIFVLGFNLSSNLQETSLTQGSRLGGALDSVISQFTSGVLVGSGQSDSTILVQFLLFLIASMALVWAFGQIKNGKTIKIRQAYYLGSATLIPTILITIILLLTLVPALIGSALLGVALQTGSVAIETTIISVIAFVLLLLSLYLFVMLWPAFYLVTLLSHWPWDAIKSAAKLTKKQRFLLLRKIFVLLLALVALMFIVMLPVAIVLPSAVALVAYCLLFVAFGLAHIFLYNLYRSLD